MAKHEKKINKKNINIKKVVLRIFIVLLIGTMGVCGYLYWSFKNNTYIKNDYGNKEKSENVNYEEVEGISNILLIGNDARSLDEKSRSDAILILSIDNINKNLKLISIMRDSYVEIPGYGEQKINHAFAFGGAELLKDTIEKNFDLKLHDYGIINFQGFQELVDSIGGLDVDVTEKERVEMNKFIPEVNPKDPHLVKKTGIQHLDGQQVLSYSRIRKIGNGDYERTERQREVISLIIDKLKDTNVLKYPMLASKLFPYVKTNMDISDILNYAYTIYKIGKFKPQQMLIPVPDITSPKVLNDKGWVVLMDIKQNAQIIYDFIFENKMYNSNSLDYESFKKAMEEYNKDVTSTSTSKPTINNDSNCEQEEETDIYESHIDISNKQIKNQINKYRYKTNSKVNNKLPSKIQKKPNIHNDKNNTIKNNSKVEENNSKVEENNSKVEENKINDNNIDKEDISEEHNDIEIESDKKESGKENHQNNRKE